MSTSNPSMGDASKLRHIKTGPRIEVGKSSIEWELPGGAVDVVAYGAMDTSKPVPGVPVYAVLVRMEGHALKEWPVIYTDNQDATRILLLQLVKRIENALSTVPPTNSLPAVKPDDQALDYVYSRYAHPIHNAIMSLIKTYHMKKDRTSEMLSHQTVGLKRLMERISWYRMTMEGLDKEKSRG